MTFIFLSIGFVFGFVLAGLAGFDISFERQLKKEAEAPQPEKMKILTGLEQDLVTAAMRVQQFDAIVSQVKESRLKILYGMIERTDDEEKINRYLEEISEIKKDA